MKENAHSPAEQSGTRRCVFWLLLVMLFGAGISLYPHFLALARSGSPTWVASMDEFECYLPLVSDSWHNHPLHLADPWKESGGDSMFPWLQIIPATLAAKAFFSSPLDICLLWRFWAGISVPAGFFLLINRYVRSPAAAAGLVIILLSATGMIEARLDRHFLNWYAIVSGKEGVMFSSWPSLLHQFRLITPGLSWFFLFLFLWRLEITLQMPTKWNLATAGLLLGFLVWLYFYYWTALFMMLGLAWITGMARRRTLFIVSALGGFAGLPSILLQRAVQNRYPRDWLERVDKFTPLSRLEGLYHPPAALAILALATLLVWWRHRDLRLLWLLCVCGIGLINSQIVTKLQLENMHWQYVFAPALCLLVAIIGYREVEARWGSQRWFPPAMAALALAYLVTGAQARHWEVTRSRQPLEINHAVQQYRAQRAATEPIHWQPRALIAGDDFFAGIASFEENLRPLRLGVGYSPALTHDEWDYRCALNDLLQGKTLLETKKAADLFYSSPGPGPWHRELYLLEQRIDHRQQVAAEIAADINGAAAREGVRYVAFQASVPAPAYLKTGWQRLQTGPVWQVWERTEKKPL